MQKKTQDELSGLQKAIEGLRERIEKLEREILTGDKTLQQTIKVRGMQIHCYNPAGRLLFTAEASPEERTTLYHLLRHYSFRLLLRDAIKKKDAFREEDLVRYCSLTIVCISSTPKKTRLTMSTAVLSTFSSMNGLSLYL